MLSLENANVLFDSTTAVLTTSMMHRIVLFICGSLTKRGAYAGSAVSSPERTSSTRPLYCMPSNPVPTHLIAFVLTASNFRVQFTVRYILDIYASGDREPKGSFNGGTQGE
jgi:hypothetical protein